MVHVKNWIKGFLYFQGMDIPDQFSGACWSKAFIIWLQSISFKQASDKYYLFEQIKDLQYYRQKRIEILRQIRFVCNDHKAIGYIRSVCGLGIISAFSLYAELFDINRFKNLDHFASLVGLVPLVKASGGEKRVRGLAGRYSKYLRSMIIESAWVAVRSDPALTVAYNKLIKRMSKQKAIIRIAKKLLNRIRYVWKNQKSYVCSVIE